MEGKYQKIFAHFIAINTSFPTKWFILPHDVKAINPYLSCCWEKMREKTVINAFRPFSLPFHFPFWVPMSALPTFIFFPCSGGKFLHSVSLFLDTCKPQTFCDVHIHALLPRFIHVDLGPHFLSMFSLALALHLLFSFNFFSGHFSNTVRFPFFTQELWETWQYFWFPIFLYCKWQQELYSSW